MKNLKDELRNLLLEYVNLEGNKIELHIINEIIDKSSQIDIEKFLKEDKELRPFAIHYIDFCSITVGIISKYGSLNISEILKKHFK